MATSSVTVNSAFLYEQITARMKSWPSETVRRVQEHVKVVTGHDSLAAYNGNGASEEDKVTLYKAIIGAVLGSKLDTLQKAVTPTPVPAKEPEVVKPVQNAPQSTGDAGGYGERVDVAPVKPTPKPVPAVTVESGPVPSAGMSPIAAAIFQELVPFLPKTEREEQKAPVVDASEVQRLVSEAVDAKLTEFEGRLMTAFNLRLADTFEMARHFALSQEGSKLPVGMPLPADGPAVKKQEAKPEITTKEFKVVALRECAVDSKRCDEPKLAYDYFQKVIATTPHYNPDVEGFYVLMLDTRRNVKGYNLVATGTLDTILVHPREVFKTAIVAASSAIILMHNHPSGDPSPSEGDIRVTRDLIRAGQMLKIDILDHVIVGRTSTERTQPHASLRELGYFYS
jgi:DNA repair protein RadC